MIWEGQHPAEPACLSYIDLFQLTDYLQQFVHLFVSLVPVPFIGSLLKGWSDEQSIMSFYEKGFRLITLMCFQIIALTYCYNVQLT